jgi:hypothetical protein
MNSILDAGGPAWGRLPHLGLMRFAGPDAYTFLQGQLSNDTRRLSAGATLLAAYSTPQGRVLAVLHLLPHSSGALALLPRELLLPTLERLRKYVLRSKVRIEDLSESFAVLGRQSGKPAAAGGAAPAPARNPGAAGGYVEHQGVGVAAVGSDAGREWAVGEVQELRRQGLLHADHGPLHADHGPLHADHDLLHADDGLLHADPAAELEHSWRLADIRAGLPQVYAATSEMFVAQMLNLDLIDGISFTKGCFTGQEIIARTQHLGRIKRRMYRLRLPAGSWTVGQAVRLADGRSGRLTELASADGGFEALAVLNLEPGGPAAAAAEAQDMGESEAASGARIEAAELPLPYPLRSA